MTKIQTKIGTHIGFLYLVCSEGYLNGVFWEKQNVPMLDEKNNANETLFKKTATQLEEYFKGTRKQFKLPLKIEGTDFQKQVWDALAKIPYGETRSYKEIAANIKNANAFRAVGTANGQNPLSIIVPCHRVISADGSIGGYAGGLDIKRKLLSLEKSNYTM